MSIALFICLLLIFYTFLGYGGILYLIVRIKRLFKKPHHNPRHSFNDLPTCTVIVAAYNEEDFIEAKIQNTLHLKYPRHKLSFIFVTDGSNDRTPEIVGRHPQITLLHSAERKGKIAAVHRAVEQVSSEVIVFTDANTLLNADALVHICRHYADKQVGAVAGEKRVLSDETDNATAGEGFYWKYESRLKNWDSELWSVVGAAGELFSIRTSLYVSVHHSSILDDFMISMRIAQKGFRIIYEPDAYATETSSANIKEELKRKIRIAAGGMQSIIWLRKLLNPFHMPLLYFQYVSHRVLRWTITPFLMVAVLVLNIAIVVKSDLFIYDLLLAGQVLFYLAALFGWLLESKNIRLKVLFIPYYFCMMNYAVIAGIFRYFFGKQSSAWEKAKRKQA